MSDDDDIAQSSLATQLYDDLVQSLASNNVSNAYNILSILEALEVKSHPSFGYFYENSAASAVVSEARELLVRWRSDLKAGDYIDKFSEIDAVRCEVCGSFNPCGISHVLFDNFVSILFTCPNTSLFTLSCRAGIMRRF
jgi:hypothetical protein